jgi:protein RecA
MSGALNLIEELDDILQANEESSLEVRSWLNTGLSPLNEIISGSLDGGFPGGRIIEIFGMQSCGKTAIATHAMISAIEAGGVGHFEDHERSFDLQQARHLGLPKDTGRFIYQKPNTYEESITRILKTGQALREKKLIPDDAPYVAVIDSLAACIPASVVDKGLDEMNMKDDLALAAATSRTMKIVANYAERYNITVIILNQLRENPMAGYGDNTKTTGGKSVAFYATTRIKLSAAKLVKKVDGKSIQIGQQVTAFILKNKAHRPHLSTEWNFVFDENGHGHLDVIGCLADYLKANGKIEMSGDYFVWEGKKYHRSQFIDHITANNQQAELEKLCRKTP